MKYECIFSDIDGTLLNDQHQISFKTKAKVNELTRQGIPFILVSARMPKGMKLIQQKLALKTPMICYSGGLIVENDKVLFSEVIDAQTVSELLDFIAQQSEVCTTVYYQDCWKVKDIQDPWVKQESQITGIIPEMMKDVKEAHKILCMGESKEISILEQKLLKCFKNVNVYRSKSTYLEIMSRSVSKAKAIKMICRQYQIPLDKTVSFGDHHNDIEMLKTTQWGFVMNNAPKEMLDQIKRHTLSNNDDGIVYALENLIGE